MTAGESGKGQTKEPTARLYQLSLLFSDLSGYTALMEASEPEDVDALRRQVSAAAERIVEKHGGIISQFYGDGLLAIFGLPAPHEEDSRRAIEAALELHEAVSTLRIEGQFPSDFEPRMHSGIETGLVLAREGNLRHGKYELTGDAVNTAARLCGAAKTDEILVSQVTLRGVEALFDLEAIPPLSIQGKRKTVVVYRVLGRSNVRTRFEARARRGLTPFVGRIKELERLRLALSDAVQARNRVVAIIGAAGIGKTRLLEEFMLWAAISDANIYRVYCESYGNVAPLQPFLQVLRLLFGLRPETPVDEATAAVEQHLGKSDGLREHLGPLLHLLSLRPWPEHDSRSSDDTQREIVAALTDVIVARAANRPLVLILDDWQWADDASRQVLSTIVRALKYQSALILIGFRRLDPNDTVPPEAEIINLEPFTEDESARAISLLVPSVMDLGLSGAIHRRSGGNPLFLEELCQSLPEHAATSGEGLAESGVPNTLHGLIQSRIGRLPAIEAEILQIASVIGNEFPFWLLERVSDRGPRLMTALGHLTSGDLIYRTEQESTFRFKHEIARDDVYQLVRRDERRKIHGNIARALEARFQGAALAEHYEALAYHYSGSNDYARAVEYADLAGNKAAATSSLDRARLQYRTALAELDKLNEGAAPTAERSSRWLVISMKWAATCVFSPAIEQLEILQRAAEYAHALHDPNAMAHAEYWLGWIYYVLGDQGQAIVHLNAALSFAEQANNLKIRGQLLSNLGQSHAAAGDYDRGLGFLHDGIELKRVAATRSRRRVVPVGFGYALGCEALLHADRGDFPRADACLREAQDAVSGSGHAVESSLMGARALVQMWQSRWAECIETASLTRATAERVNGPFVFAMSEMVTGYARWTLDRAPSALVQLRRAVDWLESRGIRLFLSCNYAYLAEALAGAGDEASARDYALRAIERATQNDPIGEASAYRTLAQLCPRLSSGADDADAAQPYLEKAIASAERRGSARERALTILLWGQFQNRAGDRAGARANLEHARAEFQRMQMPGSIAASDRLLAQLSL